MIWTNFWNYLYRNLGKLYFFFICSFLATLIIFSAIVPLFCLSHQYIKSSNFFFNSSQVQCTNDSGEWWAGHTRRLFRFWREAWRAQSLRSGYMFWNKKINPPDNYLIFFNVRKSSVSDPLHFNTDPDPVTVPDPDPT